MIDHNTTTGNFAGNQADIVTGPRHTLALY